MSEVPRASPWFSRQPPARPERQRLGLHCRTKHLLEVFVRSRRVIVSLLGAERGLVCPADSEISVPGCD